MAEGWAIKRTRSANGVEVAACMDSTTQQRREGEANGPHGQRPAGVSRGGPSWMEFVRPAHQAAVAVAGVDMINRAEPRACGHSREPRLLDPEPNVRHDKRGWRKRREGGGNEVSEISCNLPGKASIHGSICKTCRKRFFLPRVALKAMSYHFK